MELLYLLRSITLLKQHVRLKCNPTGQNEIKTYRQSYEEADLIMYTREIRVDKYRRYVQVELLKRKLYTP